jgi:hypothetical protein
MPKENKQLKAANKKKSAEQREATVQRAVELYQTLANLNPKNPTGYRTVCKMVENEFKVETGVRVALCYNTVCKRSKGMFGNSLEIMEFLISGQGLRSLTQFNWEKAWLLPEEEKAMLDFILELASRGWPLSKQQTRDHVDKIYQARLGAEFPEGGVCG